MRRKSPHPNPLPQPGEGAERFPLSRLRERAGVRGLRRAACVMATLAALAAPARAAPPCGTIVIPGGLGVTAPEPVTGLNPMIGSSLYGGQIQGLLFRPLIWVAGDGTIDKQLSMEQSIDVSDDGLTYHVTMKPWLWSDGAPVTADDVAYMFELARKEGDLYAAKGTADMPDIIKAFTVTGPLSFDVTLTHKVGQQGFILNGLAQLQPLPRHAWGKTSIDEMWRRQTDLSFFKVVDGPYSVTRYTIGRYLVLRANPHYSGEPKPQIEKIVEDFLEGVDPLRALQAGETDATNIPYTVWSAATKLPGFKIDAAPETFGFDYLGLNYRNPAVSFFRDVRVRQAIADSIDQKLIVSLVFHGQAEVRHTPLSPQLQKQFFSPAALAGQWPVGYDPAKARALLDAAGWKPGPDGVRMKDGKQLAFDFVFPSGADYITQEIEIIQQGLAAVGIRMNASELTFSQMLPLVFGPPTGWQAFTLGWSSGPWPDIMPQFGTNGTDNQVGYSDPKMDAIGTQIVLANGPEPVQDFSDYVAAQQPVIFLPKLRQTMLVRDGLEGFDRAFFPTSSWALEYLHLTGPLACHALDHHPA